MKKLISVIMPAKNEEENLPIAYERLTGILSAMSSYRYEVIVVDNDSRDRTPELCAQICTRDQQWKYIKFSRDFTAEISVTAGLRLCRGDYAIIIPSDLQEPPEMIPQFVAKAEEGFDIVSGKLKKRADDCWWKSIGAKMVYPMLNRFSDIRLEQNLTDFKLLSRQVLDVINQFHERNRYLRGFIQWSGFRTATIPYSRRPREHGKSNAPFWYLVDFTLRALTSFSLAPLRFFSILGVLIACAAFTYSVVVLLQFLMGETIPGLTTIFILLLFILAILSLGFGIVGEYIGRIYLETKRRPLWVIEKTLNIEVASEDRICL